MTLPTRVARLVVPILLTGCGPVLAPQSPETITTAATSDTSSDDGESPNESSTDSATDAAGDATTTDDGMTTTGAPRPDRCADVCVEVAGGCFDGRSCLATCTSYEQEWPDVVFEAFEACASTDPLCFISLEDCMLVELYARPTTHRVVTSASDLDPFDGATLLVTLSANGQAVPPALAEIVDGGAQVELEVVARGHDFLAVDARIDVDGNGECTPGVDHAAYANVVADLGQLWPDVHAQASLRGTSFAVMESCP